MEKEGLGILTTQSVAQRGLELLTTQSVAQACHFVTPSSMLSHAMERPDLVLHTNHEDEKSLKVLCTVNKNYTERDQVATPQGGKSQHLCLSLLLAIYCHSYTSMSWYNYSSYKRTSWGISHRNFPRNHILLNILNLALPHNGLHPRHYWSYQLLFLANHQNYIGECTTL